MTSVPQALSGCHSQVLPTCRGLTCICDIHASCSSCSVCLLLGFSQGTIHGLLINIHPEMAASHTASERRTSHRSAAVSGSRCCFMM
jgi:hypothetical protein